MIKAAQAVSGEIVLDKLIETLMRIAIEHAGRRAWPADPVRTGDEPRIAAEATTSRGKVEVTLRRQSVSPRRAARIRAPLRHPDSGKRDP